MALVLFEDIQPSIGKITFNDPDALNAMGESMAREFSTLIETLRPKRKNYRALILTGAGRAFSAGGDLEMLEGKIKLSAEENYSRMIEFYNSFLKMHELEVPLIAAINGHAVGAGLCVACACDIRIASEKAKLGFTFTKLGLHPGMGATYFLPRILGVAMATELMITGRMVDAAEALKLGLVSKVCGEGEVMPAALALCDEIKDTGPLSISQLLSSVRSHARSLGECLDTEARAQSVNYASDEYAEGIRAIREKRKAKFSS